MSAHRPLLRTRDFSGINTIELAESATALLNELELRADRADSDVKRSVINKTILKIIAPAGD